MKLRMSNRKAGGGFAARRRGSQRGQILIEVLVALAILGIVAVAFLTALTTTSLALIVADRKTTAESLTRSEFEYIQNSDYWEDGFTYELPSGSPPWDSQHALPSGFDNYSLVVTAVPIDPETHQPSAGDMGMQEVTVTVYQEGRPEAVLTTHAHKIRR